MRRLSLLAVLIIPSVSLAAQSAEDRVPMPPLNIEPAQVLTLRSRIDHFRSLLVLTPEEREQQLSEQPEPKRRVLLEKLREYEALPEEEREHRLELVELWSTLVPLMRLEPAARGPMLARLPEADRQLVEQRLRQWDLLPSDMQQDVLEHKWTIHYFLRLEASNPFQRSILLQAMPSDSRRDLETRLEQWRSLPAERRQQMYRHFNQFFELPQKEKEKALDGLTEQERLQMEASLKTFEQLAPDQRQSCIESFRKFANMSKEERAQFLRNAERWSAMTAAERQTWRNLVSLLPPQKPPMPGEPPRPLPAGSNNEQKPPLPGERD